VENLKEQIEDYKKARLNNKTSIRIMKGEII
jgi:hypothetical protein